MTQVEEKMDAVSCMMCVCVCEGARVCGRSLYICFIR